MVKHADAHMRSARHHGVLHLRLFQYIGELDLQPSRFEIPQLGRNGQGQIGEGRATTGGQQHTCQFRPVERPECGHRQRPRNTGDARAKSTSLESWWGHGCARISHGLVVRQAYANHGPVPIRNFPREGFPPCALQRVLRPAFCRLSANPATGCRCSAASPRSTPGCAQWPCPPHTGQ